MSDRPLVPSPAVAGLRAYSPPRTGTPVDLHLDGNEGPAPPAEVLAAAVRDGPESIRRYPDARPLEARLAERVGVSPDQVVVTAGGDDALERILRATLCSGRELVLPVPTFEMIDRYARLAGGDVVQVPWQEGSFPVEEALAAVTDRTSVVAVVTPNSPTGLTATASDLERLSEGAPRTLLVVDLAYVEFADEDLTGAALSLPNAVVVRSMSKAWGLAGARVGWAAGPRTVIDWLRAVGHPYAVSSPSLAIAAERLETGAEEVSRFAARVREERDGLSALLGRLGASCPPSQANFVMGRFADATWVRDALAGQGIAVRIFPGKPYLDGCLRITLPGDPERFGRLSSALVTALAPAAILLSPTCPRPSRALDALRARVRLALATQHDDEPLDEALAAALEEVGAERTWLVGTTEEEVRWARAARLLPLGVAAAGPASAEAEALTHAGAGRVVARVEEIEELTP